MTTATLIGRGLRHYWRWHLSLLAGVALASAILSGSLVVGDSVRATLRNIGAERLGMTETAVVGGERFLTEDLASRLEGSQVAPVLQTLGTIANEEGSRRANGVNVIGVDERFWQFGEAGRAPDGWGDARSIGLNDVLAARLGVAAGDTVLVRAEVPSAISRDAPLSGSTEDTETTATVRGEVAVVVGAEHFGRFGLRNEQSAAQNVFVPLATLQERLEQEGRTNLVLVAGAGAASVEAELESSWTPADAALKMREVEETGEWDLNSSRIFIGSETAEAVGRVVGEDSVQGSLTYLVNSLEGGGGSTPYSMVAAVDPTRESLFGGAPPGDDEILINQWLADQRGIGVGDDLVLRYFVAGASRELVEESATFTVKEVLPMDHPEVSESWMPDFPGVADVENCRDWDPGFELDLDRIGDEDEDYWDEHKGTPKAFLSLAAGQKLWANRFGNLTALRFPAAGIDEDAFAAGLRGQIDLADLGVTVRDVRGMAGAAVDQSMDFGGLFASMGFFLVVAALVLAGLLFAFSIERRSDQIGLLLAVGLRAKAVRRMLVAEALVLALLGGLAGIGLGVAYTKLALWGLAGGWSGAVAGAPAIVYAASPGSLLAGWLGTVVLAVAIAWAAVRKIGKAQAHRLLAGAPIAASGRVAGGAALRSVRFWLGVLFLGVSLGLLPLAEGAGAAALPAIFFGSGSALLVSGLCFLGAALLRFGRPTDARPGGVWALGMRNAVRRPGRSLTVAGVMAAGVFLVVAVNAFRLSAEQDAGERASGTGGFALYARSTIPVYEDLNARSGRDMFGLDEDEMEGVSVVPLRVSDGDDASCLNLNRAQTPIVLGVDPAALATRGAFTFAASLDGAEGWAMLESGAIPIPAAADQNTVLWALHKRLGDELVYQASDGRAVPVQLSGLLANSMLQGRILISEANFLRLYPDAGGYRAFLIDVPEGRVDAVRELLTRQLQNRGLEVVSAAGQLAEFNAVQNTYLSIFSTLGGFGILLGTVGLAVIVSRNVMERRGELGLMQAVGFRRGGLRRLVLGEHWFLHGAGVAIGTAAAALAVWPSISAPGAGLPVGLLAGLVGSIFVAGLAFCWIAAALALRGPLMDAIRNE